jgi:hypothetical protein
MTAQTLHECALGARLRECPYLWDVMLCTARGCVDRFPVALASLISSGFTALIHDLLPIHSQKLLKDLPANFLLTAHSLPAILCSVEALARAFDVKDDHYRVVVALLPCLPPQQAATVMSTFWRACITPDTSSAWKSTYRTIAQQHIVSCEGIFPLLT